MKPPSSKEVEPADREVTDVVGEYPVKKTAMITAAVAVAAASFAAPALAQDANPRPVYGNLGYTFIDGGNGANLGAATGRLGYRFNKFLGVEGEAALGVDSDETYIGSTRFNTKLKHSFAGYGVGYLPLTQQIELFGRAGYGTNRIRVRSPLISDSTSRESWNYGGGVQYLFNDQNGVRAEFTRHDLDNGPGHFNAWGLSYVRKF
jgi:outer membrane immunogenic protein